MGTNASLDSFLPLVLTTQWSHTDLVRELLRWRMPRWSNRLFIFQIQKKYKTSWSFQSDLQKIIPDCKSADEADRSFEHPKVDILASLLPSGLSHLTSLLQLWPLSSTSDNGWKEKPIIRVATYAVLRNTKFFQVFSSVTEWTLQSNKYYEYTKVSPLAAVPRVLRKEVKENNTKFHRNVHLISNIWDWQRNNSSIKLLFLVLCFHSYIEQTPVSRDQQYKKFHLLEVKTIQIQAGSKAWVFHNEAS